MLIAIKGLIGSGKTTTSNYLHEKYNAYHYNCDERVKKIYSTHAEVIKRVNAEVLNNDLDYIDMSLLRTVAFGDKRKLAKLEQIIYPYLEAEIDTVSEEYDFILLDCQQIDKLDLDITYNICLKLDEELLIKRVQERDNRSTEQIKDILKIQQQYEIKSDFTVTNNGTVKQLQKELDKVMEEINEKASR